MLLRKNPRKKPYRNEYFFQFFNNFITRGIEITKTIAFEISCKRVKPRPLIKAARIPEKPRPAAIG
jgi:hypothetical protein